jgi:hypothetical protein
MKCKHRVVVKDLSAPAMLPTAVAGECDANVTSLPPVYLPLMTMDVP